MLALVGAVLLGFLSTLPGENTACVSCSLVRCAKPLCKSEDLVVKDPCGCCDVCAKRQIGEECGGPNNVYGACEDHLVCKKNSPYAQKGICVCRRIPQNIVQCKVDPCIVSKLNCGVGYTCQPNYYCGCKAECVKDRKDCSSEFNTGPCKALFIKWYYNAALKTCMEFNYGGCGGNGNRYDSKESCEKSCLRNAY